MHLTCIYSNTERLRTTQKAIATQKKNKKENEAGARLTKRSVGRPQKRVVDDIKQLVGRNWHQLALDRDTWKNLEETSF